MKNQHEATLKVSFRRKPYQTFEQSKQEFIDTLDTHANSLILPLLYSDPALTPEEVARSAYRLSLMMMAEREQIINQINQFEKSEKK